jgi:Cu(I)/Ag(I) efflux system membrane fusion protein
VSGPLTALFLALGACGTEHAAHEATATDPPSPAEAEHVGHAAPDRGPVVIDPARRQQLGVRVEHAATRSFTRDVRVTGIVRVDERREAHVHVKFEGFVERVFVNFVGRPVRRGERLLTIYSPDLLVAETELAQALSDRDRPRTGTFAAADRAQAEALADAARSRLRLLDVPAAEIARLERTRAPSRTLAITSPIDGTVVSRDVLDGMRVMPETTLLVVADLSEVWVVADVFERDVGSVHVGQHVVVRFARGAAPDREGTVAFVAPVLDEATRSAKVRVELDNPDGVIRPGLFADVTIHVEDGERLAVPDAAVIETGERAIVFVEPAPGRFLARTVQTRRRAEGFVEIREGVSAGEPVAVGAQFLLDAESQIRGEAAGASHGGH